MRNVMQNGSYRQTIKLSHLDMEFGDPFREGGSSAVFLQGAGFSCGLAITYDPLHSEGKSLLNWGFSTRTGGAIHDMVPLSSELEFGLEADFDRKVVWAWLILQQRVALSGDRSPLRLKTIRHSSTSGLGLRR